MDGLKNRDRGRQQKRERRSFSQMQGEYCKSTRCKNNTLSFLLPPRGRLIMRKRSSEEQTFSSSNAFEVWKILLLRRRRGKRGKRQFDLEKRIREQTAFLTLNERRKRGAVKCANINSNLCEMTHAFKLVTASTAADPLSYCSTKRRTTMWISNYVAENEKNKEKNFISSPSSSMPIHSLNSVLAWSRIKEKLFSARRKKKKDNKQQKNRTIVSRGEKSRRRKEID